MKKNQIFIKCGTEYKDMDERTTGGVQSGRGDREEV